MLKDKIRNRAVLLSSIALLSFFAFEKIGNESPTAVEAQPLAKNSLPVSLASTPDIIVNTTSDVIDFGGAQQVGDLPGPDGVLSLREAIIAANNTARSQVIGFNIPTSDAGFDGTVFTIQPLTPLLPLTGGGTTIDGSTQAAFSGETNPVGPEIVLNGSLMSSPSGSNKRGIVIFSPNNRIHSLIINGMPGPTPTNGTGIVINGSNANGNIVTGCFIGTDVSGSSAVPNAGDGISIGGGAMHNIIGGVTPDARNVISGNQVIGIQINGVGTSFNKVRGNFIGTDVSGTLAVGNEFGGVSLNLGSSDNTIGGKQAGSGNVVSGNPHNAVNLDDTVGNLVQGNFIGTDVAGTTALPNSFHGVSIGLSSGSQNNTIKANIIAHNGGGGIIVGSGVSNSISRNRIFLNLDLGIDLGPFLENSGVTPNDSGDTDTGPNNLMNFPVLTSAKATPEQLVVKGTIDTPNPKTITIEFFANLVPTPGGDPSGHGEGAIFLGTKKPNARGKFTATLPPVPPGTLITATATDANGNTSEFAANIEATP